MSIVPNTELYSADSLNLPVFETQMLIDSASQQVDIYSRHKAFWKSCVIRNNQLGTPLVYFRRLNDTPREVKPNSELPLKGWGSFLLVTSADASPDGIVEFENVDQRFARIKR